MESAAGPTRTDSPEEIETLLIEEFRAALLMGEDEVVPVDTSFFDFGLSSLRLVEIKRRVEAALGVEFSMTDMINQATVARLADHLADLADPANGGDRS